MTHANKGGMSAHMTGFLSLAGKAPLQAVRCRLDLDGLDVLVFFFFLFLFCCCRIAKNCESYRLCMLCVDMGIVCVLLGLCAATRNKMVDEAVHDIDAFIDPKAAANECDCPGALCACVCVGRGAGANFVGRWWAAHGDCQLASLAQSVAQMCVMVWFHLAT